jgi:Carboxypeptidase regulatory-like domain
MRIRPVMFLLGAVVLAISMLSCGQKQGTSEAPAPANPAGKPVDAATAGEITGMIKLSGTPPKMKPINMAAEPACAKEHATPAMTEDVVPGENGTLQNVVVYLKGDFSQYTFTVPTTPAVIDQKGCQYHPHVLALMTNQPLEVINSDPVTHNIHPVPKDNREWNQSQPPGSAPIMQSFARPEVAIPVKCNVHPWMKAYIAVFNNPYFQVTGKEGTFDLKNVPPGTYTLTAWHELYGTQMQSVTIGPKESKSVTLTFRTSAAATD